MPQVTTNEDVYLIVRRSEMYALLTSEDLYHLKRIKDKLDKLQWGVANSGIKRHKPEGFSRADQSPDVVDPSGQQDS